MMGYITQSVQQSTVIMHIQSKAPYLLNLLFSVMCVHYDRRTWYEDHIGQSICDVTNLIRSPWLDWDTMVWCGHNILIEYALVPANNTQIIWTLTMY